MTPTIVALIPARAGSIRLAHKNIRPLAGHPLIAYTIAAAHQAGIFADVLVSTDSEQYARIAGYYGASVPFLRPVQLAGALSPDIEWVEHTLHRLREAGRTYDCFSILRPTSPFRLPETIQRAWHEFLADPEVHSLRAVEKCKQHPAKMWTITGSRMTSVIASPAGAPPWHSTPYQGLPLVYAQNASLEIAWTRVVFDSHTIAGQAIRPFFTKGFEGFDVNQPLDWELAELLVRHHQAQLPQVEQSPYVP